MLAIVLLRKTAALQSTTFFKEQRESILDLLPVFSEREQSYALMPAVPLFCDINVCVRLNTFDIFFILDSKNSKA
jgi:hypothetical protein